MTGEPDDFDQFRDEMEAAERKVAGEIDPGGRALVVAVLVLILAGSLALPHTGVAKGFDVLQGNHLALQEHIELPSRVFVWFATIFGVLASVLALVTRRWALAWIAVAGSAIASVFGVLAIWSRQTLPYGVHAGGPGIGLIIGTIAVIALTFHWIRVVWSRTAVLLAAEEQRRNAAAKEQRDWRSGPPA